MGITIQGNHRPVQLELRFRTDRLLTYATHPHRTSPGRQLQETPRHGWPSQARRRARPQGIVDTFSTNFPGVSVELRTHLGFTEQEIGNAILGAHHAVLESAGVLDVASSFDHDRHQISVADQTPRHPPDTSLDGLQRAAETGLTGATRAQMLDLISVTIARCTAQSLGTANG